MENIGIGAGLWIASVTARYIIANRTYRQNLNDIMSRAGRRKQDFTHKLLAREATQDLIKDTIPKAIGVLGIIGGISELVAGNTNFGLGILACAVPHLIESMIYLNSRKNQINKDSK